MRTFLIGMCDIFLILYLTAITGVQPPKTVLTVDDFYKLKSMNEELKADTQKEEEALKEKLRQAEAERAALLAEQKKQEELAAARLKELAGQKEDLEGQLTDEKAKAEEIERSLLSREAERDKIARDLQAKEQMLKEREERLAGLNQEIAAQEEARRKMESSYQTQLQEQKQTVEENQALSAKLQGEVREAKILADQIKESARKEKEEAELRAAAALAAREKAEAEKEEAVLAMETAQEGTEKAEQNARKLSATLKDITQDVETAYQDNIAPLVQTVNVAYERQIAGDATRYERELTLLPVKIDEKAYAVFPSRQVGFSWRSDKAPDAFKIMYQGQKISRGWINKEDDLIAIVLPGYEANSYAPYPADTGLLELMPTLLALRNNGNVSLLDKIRGISESYFIVNRDYLETEGDHGLKYDVRGFLGTGMHAERVVRGDQLVDLNGRLIGVAGTTNEIVRVSTIDGWSEISF